MNQTPARRLILMVIASCCVALAACGGSEGDDAVERFGLKFKADTPIAWIDMWLVIGAGVPTCFDAYVYFEIENRDGATLPTDLAIERVTISNADGSGAWSLPVESSFLYEAPSEPPRWKVVAERCAVVRASGERIIPFSTGSLVRVTVELTAEGMRGRLQEHGVTLRRFF